RFANLRLLYTYMFTFPGKKLLFMGNEIAQGREWNFDASVEWHLLEYEGHQGIQKLVGDLNRIYRDYSALHRFDFNPEGFEWIDCNASEQSVLAYLRSDGSNIIIAAFNFTPVPHYDYRVGVPVAGTYLELLNSDSDYYGGSGVGNNGQVSTQDVPWNDKPCSLSLSLPPLGGVILQLQKP
ncbi:MAG: alpha amylase C-terminal domain-containing protein, partial [Gammaproteobacteria bacterium]|nr:alpha amylase C-terminal domain-containing protein [Gammaproteobacteria bacterium]